MNAPAFNCTKCGHTQYETTQIRTTGSGLSRFLNLQNQKFTVIACSDCGYAELYKQKRGGVIGDILDIITN